MENKNREIIRSNFKSILKNIKYENIKIQEITQKSKFSRQTFYYHFKNIEDLLNFTFRKEIKIYFKNKKKEYFLENYFKFIFENKEYILNVDNDEILKKLFENIILEIKKEISEYECVILSSISFHWLKKGLVETPKDLCKIILKLTF